MSFSYSRQQGVALLISLIMLLLLTVLAITAATQSTLQERMATNSQMQNTAFQNVESGFKRWDAAYRNPTTNQLTIATLHQTYTGSNFKVRIPAYPLTEKKALGVKQVGTYSLGPETFGEYVTDVVVTAKACPSSGSCNVDDKTDGLARAETTQGFVFRYSYPN